MAAAIEPHLRTSTPGSDKEHIATSRADVTPTAATSSNDGQSTSPKAPSEADGDRAKRKRQPRNSACQSCAALKMKCIATAVQGVCERCSRMNRECLPAIPKPRKRRATDGFEPKGIPPSDLLENDSPYQQSYAASAKPHVTESNGSPPHPPILRSESSEHDYAFRLALARGLLLDERSADYLLRNMDYAYAQRCCDEFRYHLSSFPFVEASYVDLMAMATSRPLTLVAICTVTSSARPEIRSRLAEAFRHALATRCVIDAEQNLDLMVGLLIYVAWHHHYFRKQQMYQYLCLLAGMATDLGIHKTPTLAEQARGLPKPELQKAFIGIYYLCQTFSFIGFHKPAPLQWTPALDYFASALSSSSARDVDLQPYIEMARILEDHAALLTAAPSANAAAYADLAVKASLARLDHLRRVNRTAPLSSRIAGLTVQMNFRRTQALPQTSKTLLSLTTAVRDYWTELFAVPSPCLQFLSIVDFTNVMAALVLSCRLSMSPPASTRHKPGGLLLSDPVASQAFTLPDATIETIDRLYSHFASAAQEQHHDMKFDSWLVWLRDICTGLTKDVANRRSDHSDSPFEPGSANRERRSSFALSHMNHNEGRFRAVNTDIAQLVTAPAPPWSPLTGSDHLFGFSNGIALLDENFWVAYTGGVAR